MRGEILLLKETLNTMVEQLRSFAAEVTRVAREVGTEGKLGGQAVVPGVAGTWKDLTDNVNLLAANLTTQVRNIAEVTTAVARGDLSRKITVDVKGEILELKNTINTMVDQLNAFASEVTRVAREVGTEGKLGGQAAVPGVAGTWKDLTDTVNVMAANLTEQVRGIVKVVTAVANGDLKQNLTVKSMGEVAALAETINNMTDTLATFADQVTTVAREVGVEGRLGGQANVPGAAGTWKDLTGNVNLLAANLTTQVRAIAEVATAVTKGDLTRSIQVEARGEVAELKDNINTMIGNLRLTTDRNTEQDWLKTNLARFTNMLQGQRDLATVGRMLLSELAPLVNSQNGVIYLSEGEAGLKLLSAFADNEASLGHPERLYAGQGLIGQCAADARRMLITQIPDEVVPISSGLFKAMPKNVIVLPVLFEGQVKAVIELASLGTFTDLQISFLDQLTASIGIVLNSIEATMQTEGLLTQSQQLATELQTQQRELQQTNEQLEQKAQQLEERNVEVERKNQEIEQARRALEDKATELAQASKYKSDFLANMSHELRTPLNSILILGQQLGDNPEGNLSAEAGRVRPHDPQRRHRPDELDQRHSRPVEDRIRHRHGRCRGGILCHLAGHGRSGRFGTKRKTGDLSFDVQIDPKLDRSMITDSKRLQQVLKNLLSNAFKFTEQGGVKLSIHPAISGWTPDHPVLKNAPGVVAFEVSDTGIGIPPEKQKIIFEAFQQADASTNRRFGGTGLGLAISRELSSLLGGEIQLRSTPGIGSTFTLYLPIRYVGPAADDCAGSRRSRTTRPPAALAAVRLAELPVKQLSDDREILQPGDTTLLIVEDDPHYAGILADLAHDAGFKVLVAMRGADALALAREYQPTAVSLDVFLPDMLGWTVLSQLKQDPADAAHSGASRHARRRPPAWACPRRVFLCDKAFDDRGSRSRRLGESRLCRIAPPAAAGDRRQSGRAAEHHRAARPRRYRRRDGRHGSGSACSFREQQIDCVVLDLRVAGHVWVRPARDRSATMRRCRISRSSSSPARSLSSDEDAQLHAIARSVVVKGVELPERLLDETALFLHRVVADLPAEQAKNAGASAPLRRGLGRENGSAGGRRCAQHLRPEQRPGAPRHECPDGDDRQGSNSSCRIDAGVGDRADGHHDARNGRVPDHASDPRQSRFSPPADHRLDGQGDEG